MTTTKHTDAQARIKDKVQKLLAQAADREGTPEGDVFYAKAFALMAEYGFEERDLDNPTEGDEVIHKTYEFAGKYTDMQARLLHSIAQGLHCTGFTQRKYNSPGAVSATLFGLRRHIERVDMLYALLTPVMIAGAQKLTRENWYEESTIVLRRSFMSAFATTVGQRLKEAETTVGSGDESYAVVLLDDQSKANAARDDFASEHGFHLSSYNSKRSFSARGWESGAEAGNRADLGQTRVGGKLALN